MANRQMAPVSIVQALVPLVVNDDTEGTGVAIDTANAGAVELVVQVGISADTLSGSVKVLPVLQESDASGSGFAAAATTDVVGAFTLIDDAAEDAVVQRVAYIGRKRYIRVFLDTTGTHTNGTPCSAVAVLSRVKHSA